MQAEDGIRDSPVTGVQTCALPIYAYQPPMFRPFENYPMALLPEVYEEASQELLDLLGFKVWFGIGHRGDFDAERISRDTPIIGELKP